MFAERATEPEWMDAAEYDRNLAERSFRFIEVVNRYFGGVRIVRRFVADQANGRLLRVLDIGSGSCDIPLAVARWAAKKNLNVHFTCLEKSEAVAQIARRRIQQSGHPAVVLVREDVFDHQPEAPYDWAVGSMFFHHLNEERILILVRHLQTMVRKGLLINDLRRSRPAFFGCLLLCLGFPPDVRHDALLSIRKGFKEEEMRSLLQRLANASVDVRPALYFRVQALIRFLSEKNA